MPGIFFCVCGTEDACPRDPLVKQSPTLPRPQLFRVSSKRHTFHKHETSLGERKNKEGKKKGRKIDLQTVISRAMLRAVLTKWLLAEEIKPQLQITPRGGQNVSLSPQTPHCARRAVGPSSDEGTGALAFLAAGTGRAAWLGLPAHCLPSRDRAH